MHEIFTTCTTLQLLLLNRKCCRLSLEVYMPKGRCTQGCYAVALQCSCITSHLAAGLDIKGCNAGLCGHVQMEVLGSACISIDSEQLASEKQKQTSAIFNTLDETDL